MANNISTPINSRFGKTGLPPITPEAAASGVYSGTQYDYVGGSQGVAAKDVFVPLQQAWGGYGAFSPEEEALMVQIMNAKRGVGQWGKQEISSVYADGIGMSNYIVASTGRRVTPLQALSDFYLKGEDIPGYEAPSTGRKGGGGGYSGPVTQTRLSDPMTAESLLDNSLRTYLGRSATPKEKDKFLQALNSYERKNPTVTTPAGTGFTVTTGGAQPSVFAEEYAQAQEGAAEFQAATTYLDSFLKSLGNPVG